MGKSHSRRRCTIAVDTIRFANEPAGWCRRWPYERVVVVAVDGAMMVAAAVNIVLALSQAIGRKDVALLWSCSHQDTVAVRSSECCDVPLMADRESILVRCIWDIRHISDNPDF